jgi:homogentisate 1,2-dioxygenase
MAGDGLIKGIGSGVKFVLRVCKGLWRGFNFEGTGAEFWLPDSGKMKMSAVVYAE